MFAKSAGTPWLAQLNDAQRAAATHRGGALLILAGAGTGKTTTLCARVAWLLTEGVPASRILLLTFTRRAARELVQRARALAERAVPGAERVTGGTFHSIAHRMVRRHASALGLPAGFGVLDAGDAADLLAIVREEVGCGAGERRFPRPQTMLDIYSRTVNAQTPLEEVLSRAFPWCAEHREVLAEIFRAYAPRKRALGVVDLDDLLLYWRALVCDEVIGASIGGAYEHVLVDEYQDVNGLQAEIVRGLRRTRDAVTAVGDDFQAIYGFRAASPRHMREFPEHFPGARIVKLERNYRSTEPILAVANAVAEQDRAGIPKRLCSERGEGQRPELCFPGDEGAQAAAVCERVLAAREEGMDLRAQAVLFRAAHDPALLEIELTSRGIPFVKYGGLRYLDAAHVRDLIAALRLTTNPADEMSWFRLLRLIDGVGPARARRILEALRPPGGGAPDSRRWMHARAHAPSGSRPQADALLAALATHGESAAESAAVTVERLSDALVPLIRARYDDGAVRAADLDLLVLAARGARDVRHFVGELALDPPSSSADLAGPPHLDEDYLVLSTVHSAKGLEWDAVHLLAAYDGNFPADMSAGSEEEIAEERRLFYVALTRARRRLHVYVPARYHHRPHGRDDAHGYAAPSRFLTPPVRSLFAVTGDPAGTWLGAGEQPNASAAGAREGRRIEVSVEALFA